MHEHPAYFVVSMIYQAIALILLLEAAYIPALMVKSGGAKSGISHWLLDIAKGLQVASENPMRALRIILMNIVGFFMFFQVCSIDHGFLPIPLTEAVISAAAALIIYFQWAPNFYRRAKSLWN